jgi:response regulator of citrate/malate metabolism
MSKKLFQAALSKYEAQRDEALAVLDVYLKSSVGIGEHSNLLEEVTKWTETLTEAEENIETIKRHFSAGGKNNG